jgi:adenine C2-methylase RlmN of 23S rRNA A2503 and tRNA A37
MIEHGLPSIKSYDKGGLRALMEHMGQPAYRARQVAAWLYGEMRGTETGTSITSFEQMTDLPRSLRERLTSTCTLDPAKILRRYDSRDGSRKYLIQLAGGIAAETVAIPSSRGRLSVCFSSQVGCAMGCIFCATGRGGLIRSLGPGEMVDQLLMVARDFATDPPQARQALGMQGVRSTQGMQGAQGARSLQDARGTQGAQGARSLQDARGTASLVGHVASLAGRDAPPVRVSNAVAMGQGEPFANYNAVLGALRLINDERLLGIGARHLTISTCGLLDGIHRFAKEPEQFTLAVSLHSAVQQTRDRLMPGLTNQPLAVLREELLAYAGNTGRRPSLEYALIASVNDSTEELNALIEFAKGQNVFAQARDSTVAGSGTTVKEMGVATRSRGAFNFHVNLIALNKIEGSRLSPSPPERVQAFAAALSQAGIDANIRASRGQDIKGACGQLGER